MQNRIDRLEGLVLSLMTNGAQSAGPAAAQAAISRSQSDSTGSASYPLDLDRDDDDMIKEEEEGGDSEVDGVTNSLGVLKVDADKGKSLYFGDSHWHLVLADVSISILYSWAIYSLWWFDVCEARRCRSHESDPEAADCILWAPNHGSSMGPFISSFRSSFYALFSYYGLNASCTFSNNC
jgi:hypothetical protein